MSLAPDHDASTDHLRNETVHLVHQPTGEPDELLDGTTVNHSGGHRRDASTSAGIRKQESYISDYEIEQQSKDVKASGQTWHTTLLRVGPIAGICALLLTLLSLLVALAILLVSRGEAADWNVPPSSCLAICTAIANQALRFAAFQGVAIAWVRPISRSPIST